MSIYAVRLFSLSFHPFPVLTPHVLDILMFHGVPPVRILLHVSLGQVGIHYTRTLCFTPHYSSLHGAAHITECFHIHSLSPLLWVVRRRPLVEKGERNGRGIRPQQHFHTIGLLLTHLLYFPAQIWCQGSFLLTTRRPFPAVMKGL
jgi:hypothetical protein